MRRERIAMSTMREIINQHVPPELLDGEVLAKVTPVDCVLSEWSEWSVTSQWSECVNGEQTRTLSRERTVLTLPEHGGAACGPTSETITITRACSAPAQTGAKYRYQQPYLFQTVRKIVEPARLPGGSSLKYDYGTVGPTDQYVHRAAGWPWDHRGGDWIDFTGARQGSVPWFSVRLDAVAGNAAIASYSVPITITEQAIQSKGRWNAFVLRCRNGSRALAGVFNPTHPAPRIDCEYEDGTQTILACRITAANTSSSAYPITTDAEIQLPVFVEFDRPEKPVARAILHFTITQHWSSTAPIMEGFILDPPVNHDPVEEGVASDQPLDAGLVGHPDMLGVHRYLDGTQISDFKFTGRTTDLNAENAYDPGIYGAGATDLSKVPHIGQGKWVGRLDSTLVESTYTGDNFVPLAPGLGALRVTMPRALDTVTKIPITDGSTVGYGGSLAADAHLFMPENEYGFLDHIFVRHYMRIASAGGVPYSIPIEEKYQVYKDPQSIAWTDTAGKFGIMPCHTTDYGGVSGTSGGTKGWQMRLSWSDVWEHSSGPAVGGIHAGLHTYDFQNNNPPGYRYTSDQPRDSQFGQRGGLGAILYADRWYCIECEMKLNTVMLEAPGFVPDGEVRIWIDGRLTLERTGMVVRQLPVYNPASYEPALILRPIRELGVRSVWFNWFHGGTTKNSRDRVTFITGVAWGRARIGPMNIGG